MVSAASGTVRRAGVRDGSGNRYAKSGDLNIAYQVIGKGEFDLVFIRGWITHLELEWEEPSQARFFRRLATFSRLIMFDKRGIGLSDRIPRRTPAPRGADRRHPGRHGCGGIEGCRPVRDVGGRTDGRPLRGDVPRTHEALILFTAFARAGCLSDGGGRARRSDAGDRTRLAEQHGSLDPVAQHPGRRNVRPPLAHGVALRGESRGRALLAPDEQHDRHPRCAAGGPRPDPRDVSSGQPLRPWSVRVAEGRHRRDRSRSRGATSRTTSPRRSSSSWRADMLPRVGDVDALIDEVQGFLTGVRGVAEPTGS